LLVTGSHTHQENYAAAFAADKRAKLIAVTDEPNVDAKRRELNEQLARALGVAHEPDLAKALARKDVAAVSVCAPPDRRGRIIVQCAEAKKHLYLDKSLAPKLAEADAIVAAVKQAGVRSHMFTMITQPWLQEAKRLVAAGKLGKLVAIHADAFFAKGATGTAKLKPRQEKFPPDKHQLVEAKRELDNVGVYPLAHIRWLTGKRLKSLYAVTGNYFFQEHQKHDVEDFGLIAGTLEDGVTITISAGRFGWTTHPSFGVNRMLLVGSERTLLADANRPRLETYTTETPWVPPPINPEDPMGFWQSTTDAVHVRPKRTWVAAGPTAKSDAAYFLDCLEADRDSEITAAEAALSTEALVAAYLSASNGKVVELPLGR
jgi:predicted dehydrogenase